MMRLAVREFIAVSCGGERWDAKFKKRSSTAFRLFREGGPMSQRSHVKIFVHRQTMTACCALVAASLAIAHAPPVFAQTPAAATDRSSNTPVVAGLPSFAPLVKQVLPAVVNISATQKSGTVERFGDNDDNDDNGNQSGPEVNPFEGFPPSPFDQFLRRFFNNPGFGQRQPMPGGTSVALGSGFIIDPTGYVVTNNHVVKNADKVTVIFQDGSKHDAKIIGRDAKTDLALLKIAAPTPLPFVSWGDSDALKVGDWVLAVGNPFGLGGSVSPGTIAARGRDIQAGPYDDFLQIDASINRGNSGGPSFDLAGHVIGINTAIYSPNGGSVGIGFAIPSDLAKPVIEQLKEHGKIERGWLGVQIQTVTPELARSLGLAKEEGALVASVTPDSPAAMAGIKQGDVILSFGGRNIEKMRDLPILVAETPVGNKADISVWRDHATQTLSPVIAKMPANPEVAENGGGDSVAGLELATLTARWRQQLHVPASVTGAVVTSIASDSPLADLGLQRGDVIESVNQKPVTNAGEAVAAIKEARDTTDPDKHLLILLNRHGVNDYVALSLGNPGTG
jgi:serine protease Do